MLQQINLYQPESRVREAPFSAMTMLILFVITLVLMMGFYGVLQWKKSALEAEVAALKQQNELTLQTVEKLEATVKKLTDSKIEEQKLKHLKRVYASKQQALNELSTMVRGNSTGVSEYFSALARKDVEAIWFKDINVYSGGKQIILQGRTTDARSIPQFVSSLNEEKVFEGVNFKLFEAKRNDKEEILNFTMQTETKSSELNSSQ